MATVEPYLPPHPDYSRLDLQRTLLADAPAETSGDDEPYRLTAWMTCPPPGFTRSPHMEPRDISHVHFARVHRGKVFDVVTLPVSVLPFFRKMVLLGTYGVFSRYDSPFSFSRVAHLGRAFRQDTGDAVSVPVDAWVRVMTQIDIHFRDIPSSAPSAAQVAL